MSASPMTSMNCLRILRKPWDERTLKLIFDTHVLLWRLEDPAHVSEAAPGWPRLSRFGLYRGGASRKRFPESDRIASVPLVLPHTGRLQSEPTCATPRYSRSRCEKSAIDFFDKLITIEAAEE